MFLKKNKKNILIWLIVREMMKICSANEGTGFYIRTAVMKELREEAVKLIWLSYAFSVLDTSQKFMLARWSCWCFGKECF